MSHLETVSATRFVFEANGQTETTLIDTIDHQQLKALLYLIASAHHSLESMQARMTCIGVVDTDRASRTEQIYRAAKSNLRLQSIKLVRQTCKVGLGISLKLVDHAITYYDVSFFMNEEDQRIEQREMCDDRIDITEDPDHY